MLFRKNKKISRFTSADLLAIRELFLCKSLLNKWAPKNKVFRQVMANFTFSEGKSCDLVIRLKWGFFGLYENFELKNRDYICNF